MGLMNSTYSNDSCFTRCSGMQTGPWVWSGFSMVFFLLGTPAICLVLWELMQRHRKGISNDIFMLNLAIMDLVFIVFVPFGVINFMVWHNVPFDTFVNFIYSFNISGRPLFMACLCMDCYLAVVHPIFYMTRKKGRERVAITAVVWILTLSFGVPLTIHDLELLNSEFAIIPYGVSIPIITYCDLAILCALRKPDPAGNQTVHPQKRRAVQAVLNSFVMTVVSYLPPVVLYITIKAADLSARDSFCHAAIPALISPSASSAIMPILYLQNLGRLDLDRLVHRCWKHV